MYKIGDIVSFGSDEYFVVFGYHGQDYMLRQLDNYYTNNFFIVSTGHVILITDIFRGVFV